MALAILDKYATTPTSARSCGPTARRCIPPIAQADTGPEALALLQSKERRAFAESLAKLALLASGDNGQAMIRMIKDDGLERVAYLNTRRDPVSTSSCRSTTCSTWATSCAAATAPTSGEMTWALVDGCFVVADVLSLAAVQPEGAVAAEAARTEVKAAAREGARSSAASSSRPGASRPASAGRPGASRRGGRRRAGGSHPAGLPAGGRCGRPGAFTRSCGGSPKPYRR